VASELLERGHRVKIFEPADGWSFTNLLQDYGPPAIRGFYSAYPMLRSIPYKSATLDLDAAFDGVDLVLVHEWNDPELVIRIGLHRKKSRRYRLLFHDTHHRAVTAPEQMRRFDLSNFDGVLVFGEVLSGIYRDNGWADRIWVWHEAADIRIFHPMEHIPNGDVVWVGNWGDEERSEELQQFLIDPVRELNLHSAIYGVRYPETARATLRDAGIAYRGWLPNYRVPEVFGRFRATIHVPRRPYARALPGIPTIRVFEALACGIPLVSSPWEDTEKMFRIGEHFLMAKNRRQMREFIRLILNEPQFARKIAAAGRKCVLEQHTCAHRVEQLLRIAWELGVNGQERALA
jgi:spore maturation protein CgeB